MSNSLSHALPVGQGWVCGSRCQSEMNYIIYETYLDSRYLLLPPQNITQILSERRPKR